MARCPFARWAPDGATPGGAIVPRVAILHCTAVDFDAHPHDGLEWHFEIDFDGNIDQLVDTERRADANNLANGFAVSIETWGRGDTAWTPAQVVSIIRLLRWLNATHPAITLERCTDPYGHGLGHHTMFGAPSAWTPYVKSCPGPLRKQQFDELILPAFQSSTAMAVAASQSQEDSEMFLMHRESDGSIFLGGPGLWRGLNPEQAGVAVAITKMPVAIPANDRQVDVARDLCLTGFLGPDELAARVAGLVDGIDPADITAAVKQALREGTG